MLESSFGDLKIARRGKVRDIYKIDDEHLLIVATDRISAFDCVLPTPIARKGEVLTALSSFWFQHLAHIVPNHLVTTEVDLMPEHVKRHKSEIDGRSMLVIRADVFPVECVVRGYISGSGWKDYSNTGSICGVKLPEGLKESDKLPEPIFTPATKAEEGHDQNIDEQTMAKIVGEETTAFLRDTSLKLYREASQHALGRGIIIADTKFEFGRDRQGRILLIDEALTPDSSRFWPANQYQPGRPQPSFDKQFVRDYLVTVGWNKQPPAPPLPDEVREATSRRYLEAYRLLTGSALV